MTIRNYSTSEPAVRDAAPPDIRGLLFTLTLAVIAAGGLLAALSVAAMAWLLGNGEWSAAHLSLWLALCGECAAAVVAAWAAAGFIVHARAALRRVRFLLTVGTALLAVSALLDMLLVSLQPAIGWLDAGWRMTVLILAACVAVAGFLLRHAFFDWEEVRRCFPAIPGR